MDIKRKIGQLQIMERMGMRIVQSGDAAAESRYYSEIDDAMRSIDAWVDMANAAIAVAEYQATIGYDPEVDNATYTPERGRLWHAFITARAKVKGVSWNEST